MVTIPAEAYLAIEDEIRKKHLCSMDEPTAMEGYMNIIVWGTPFGGAPVILTPER